VLTIIKEVLLNPFDSSEFEKEKAGYWLGWSSKRKSTICQELTLSQFYTTMSMAI
jgi:hypothetical protein